MKRYKKTIIALFSIIGAIINAQELPKSDSSNWQALNKNIKISNKSGILTAINSAGRNNGVIYSFSNFKINKNTVIKFDWKCDSKGKIFYAAFVANSGGKDFYIWDKGKNAFMNFKKAEWHKVVVPATTLKTLKGQKLQAGSIIQSLKFFQVGEKTQEFSIRNFQITEEKTENISEMLHPKEINIWPRNKQVYIPTGLEQFVFFELPAIKEPENVKVKLTLPTGMIIASYPSSPSWAVLPKNHIIPEKTIRKEDCFELTFADKDIEKYSSQNVWIAAAMKVDCQPGDYSIKVEIINSGKVFCAKAFKTKIYPKLKEIKLEQLQTLAWSYNGLDKKSVPIYVDALRSAGINTIGLIRGEGSSNERSVTDYALNKGMKLILAFFVHDAIKFAENKKIFSNKDFYHLSYLLDHPDKFKELLKAYIQNATKGKNYSGILYDAESTALVGDKIYGDLSDYSLERFRKFAEIDSNVKLTPQVIKEKFSEKWVWYRCKQSNEITEILRELIDEDWPDRKLHVYSGYEFDNAPFKDRTRERYGVDWKSIADTGLDYGNAGYGGTEEVIQATSDALKGKAIFIPAEMFLVNFNTKRNMEKSPEEWSMRLISSFLNSGMKGGLSIWYGCDLDGSALIAMNKAFDFMQRIEPFALKGKRADKSVNVYPDQEKRNVYVLRKGGNTMIIATNTEANDKIIRIRLKDFTLKGYTSDLSIKDMVSGEQIPAKRVIKIKIPSFSYRLLNILDDGN